VNGLGLLCAWSLALWCAWRATSSRHWALWVLWLALSAAFMVATAAFLWHVRRGEA
jgi:hypothetical protein